MTRLQPIRSSHAITSGTDEQPDAVLTGSAYRYLFKDLADESGSTSYSGGDAKTHAALRGLSHAMGANLAPPRALPLAPVYTYFGQFLSHDTSAPVTSSTGEFRCFSSGIIAGIPDPIDLDATTRPAKADAVLATMRNQHLRPLTLYSLYGTGPFGQTSDTIKSFYKDNNGQFETTPCGPLPGNLNQTFTSATMPKKIDGTFDIPRRGGSQHVPLIVDRRNDDNLILSQLHLAMMLFHNKAMETLAALPGYRNASTQAIFDAARKLVTWHYQWVVLHDFLPTLLHRGSVEAALRNPYTGPDAGAVPLEFSTAALRIGHSMVSAEYDFNENFGVEGHTRQLASLGDLFAFTSHSMMADSSEAQLPSHWSADWKRLTKTQAGAEPVDSVVASPMLTSLGPASSSDHASIAFRNLLRGFHRRIPFGQDIAHKLGLNALSPAAIGTLIRQGASNSFNRDEMTKKTPLWFYFLCEAQLQSDGKSAGPIASRIIAGTIVSLLAHDQTSVLTAGKQWTPEKSELRLPGNKPIASISDMLAFAGLMS